MSKKKNTSTATKAEETIEEKVVEQEQVTDTVVETPTEEVKAEEIVDTPVVEEETKVEETPTEEPVVTEEEQKPVEEVVQPKKAMKAQATGSDKYGSDIAETPTTTEPEAETPVEEEKPTEEQKEVVDIEKMKKEMMKEYVVKYSFSQNSRRLAIKKKMTLYNMYDVFIKNRQAFVALVDISDFNKIKEFMLGNACMYNYQVINKTAKQQFLDRLEYNTNLIAGK